ncbi:MAG: class I SAM-dependent methyltransferase [Deltaproteobacteria bacterium]|nr:class I SAM-dependent methyltransferase [Deltaproteobacteria bacterium]
MDANADQIDFWNDAAGRKWVRLQELIDRQLADLGRIVIERAAPAPGERVLDIGCGCGASSLELATRVDPEGSVLGVDISEPMLARARERTQQAGLDNLSFQCGDAQVASFQPDAFDLLHSRFGIMFFEDPPAAFTNMRRALAPKGRVTFVCWQPLSENPWMRIPMAAALPHLDPPPIPAPGAPGPFALGDDARVWQILDEAGFRDIEIESHERTLTVGGDENLERTVDFILEMGPTGAALRDAEVALVERVRADVIDAVAPYHGEAGLCMESRSWIASARA